VSSLVFKHGNIPWNKGKHGIMPISWNKGKKMNAEYKQKVSKGNILRFQNPSAREKISKSHQSKAHKLGYKKQSESLKKRFASGLVVWNKGLTKETDHRIPACKDRERKRIDGLIRWQNDEEYRQRVVVNSMKALFSNRPTSLERKFLSLIEKYNLPYEYVGDGKLVLGGCNPDFRHRSELLLIEVANRIHHIPSYEKRRYAIFIKYGYRTCTLWQEYFEREDWEKYILSFIESKGFLAVCRASIEKK
jgi:hypothetical protein